MKRREFKLKGAITRLFGADLFSAEEKQAIATSQLLERIQLLESHQTDIAVADNADAVIAIENPETKDVVVTTTEAFLAALATYKSLTALNVEVTDDIKLTATEKAVINGIQLSGQKGQSNAKVLLDTKEVDVKNAVVERGATIYNVFEGTQAKTKKFKSLTFDGVNVNDPELRHNVFSFYTPDDNAVITVKNSKFVLNPEKSNVMRLANVANSQNVKVLFENVDWNLVGSEDFSWAGLLIYQPTGEDVTTQGDLSKLSTWEFVFKNCQFNNVPVTTNGFGTKSQVFYLYNIGGSGEVSDPVAAGLNVVFE